MGRLLNGFRNGASSKWVAALIILVIALSIIPRTTHLNASLLEVHGFRQTQTAMTVKSFVEEGFWPLEPKLPVFGPPWTVPMNFPVYELTAATLVRGTGMSVDAGCRLTNIFFFYLSAAMLFLVVRECGNTTIALFVCALYLLSPLTIRWSQAALIEFTAVAFGLAYVYCLLRWINTGTRLWIVVGIVCGSLAVLAKSTSILAMAPVLFFFSVAFLWQQPGSNFGERVWNCRYKMMALTLFAAVPMAVGMIWVRYSDHVKNGSPLTSFLTSEGLKHWNYGSLSQRMAFGSWRHIFGYLGEILPSVTRFLPLLSLVFIFKAERRMKLLLLGALCGAVLPMMIFFNLYVVHDYYFCAIVPCVAILAGYGIYALNNWLAAKNQAAAALCFTGLVAFFFIRGYVDQTPSYDTERQHPTVQLARVIEKLAPSNDYVLVSDHDWNPDILYYSNRRGCMLFEAGTPHSDTAVSVASFRDAAAHCLPLNHFTTLVTQHPDDDPALKWYCSHETLAFTNKFYIMRITDPVPMETVAR